MSIPWSEILVAIIAALVTHLLSRPEIARQRRRADEAEQELRAIHRRGKAPHYQATRQFVRFLYLGISNRLNFTPGSPDRKTLVDGVHTEVDRDLPPASTVRFVVENVGAQCKTVAIPDNPHGISLHREQKLDDAGGLDWLEYHYVPAAHGQSAKFSLIYETAEGVQDRHTYEIRIGCNTLRRLDPPEAQDQREH